MRTTIPMLKPLILAFSVTLTACGGGGGGGGSDDVTTASKTLSGTAAAGAPMIGQVTVKGAMGNTKSALIEADGNYTIDVTGLTAPYRLRAVGTVGGRTYKLHSYAEEADVGGNVNITPFTDLIVSNAAQQIAENFFDSATDAGLDPAVVDAQEDALQAKLQDVFDALGVSTAIDLLNSTFSADHSGLDAALDIIKIEVDTTSNVATISNLVENTSISDYILDTSDNNETLTVSDPGALMESVSDTQAIAAIFDSIEAAFTAGLPSQAAIEDYFSSDFYEEDRPIGPFLTEITTDPTLIGLSFNGVSISDLDSALGTATVTFHFGINDVFDLYPDTWFVAKDPILGWQLRGDQRIVDTYFDFHCNDYDGTDNQPGGCGINTRFWDEDFSNNGTADTPIASGTVSIIDGTDGVTVKDVVYLGTPSGTAPGDVQIYDEANENYSGDWKGFGTGLGLIDSSIFQVGDTIEYKLYTEDLDVSNPLMPSIATGAVAVVNYTDTLLYAPSTTAKYPTATSETLSAMDNFTLDDDLVVAWTLADGTRSDEVLVEISDSAGNRIEVWDESFDRTVTSTTIASTLLSSTAATDAGLDPDASNYTLLVRIYAEDELTGQFHSIDYRASIPGPGTGGGTGSTFTCGYASGWNDTADGGLGAPLSPNSFADYEAVIADCGTAQAFTVGDVSGSSFLSDGETYTFFNTGSGTETDPGTGEFDPGVTGEPIIAFEWYVEDATCAGCTHNYVVVYSDDTIAPDLSAGVWFRETSALTGVVGTPGVASAQYSFVKYSEQSNYSDNDRATGSDGEIWYSTDVLQ